MIHHLKGKMIEKSPTHIVMECAGVGYMVNISLNTFSALPDDENCLIYTYLAVREDAQTLYGFATPEERSMFKKLTSVSGIGNATGQMILSSLTPSEVSQAILGQDVATIKKIKGIGAKTAQRLIVDLQDKVGDEISLSEKVPGSSNTLKNEALLALSSLGIDKTKAETTIDKIIQSEGKEWMIEDLIKRVLKTL